MSRDRFWLTDAQFARIEPHLPTDTRGKPRVDDRRVISGIVRVLKSGGRWIDAPPDYGPRKTLYNRYVRWAAKGVWVDLFHALASAGGPPAQVLIDSSAVQAHRSASGGKGGERNQAIGRSRGGRTTKLHARCYPKGRLLGFVLTGGEAHDVKGFAPLLRMVADKIEALLADKGYDADAIREALAKAEIEAVIPTKRNRKNPASHDAKKYKWRNLIERLFSKLKNWWRVATRYDKRKESYLGFVAIAAVKLWLPFVREA